MNALTFHILEIKSIYTVSQNISFVDAVTKMYKNGIGNLIVVNNDKVTGLLSERQILQYVVTEKIIFHT